MTYAAVFKSNRSLAVRIPAAMHSAAIRADLTRKGQLVGPNDLLIAGHARSRNPKLITSDPRQLARVDGLRCEGWL